MFHGDYEFVATKNSKFVSEDCIDEARQFLKKYRIFFALVCGNNFNGKYFDNYLKGKTDISDLPFLANLHNGQPLSHRPG